MKLIVPERRLIRPTRRALIVGAASSLAAPAIARAQLMGTGFGSGGASAARSTYVGPGDIVSGALAWHGLRGYNAAYASPGTNPAIDIRDQANLNPVTINILSTGDLDYATINAWVTAHSVTTILVHKIYDQTGNGLHLSVGLNTQQPALALSPSGIAAGKAAMLQQVPGTPASQIFTSAGFTLAQPLSISVVAMCTSLGSFQGVYHTVSTTCGLGFNNSTMGMCTNSGSFGPTVAVSNNVFYAANGTLNNGGTAHINISGSTATSTPSTVGMSGVLNMFSLINGTDFLKGYICEGGVWGSDTSANASALNSNQRTYWVI